MKGVVGRRGSKGEDVAVSVPRWSTMDAWGLLGLIGHGRPSSASCAGRMMAEGHTIPLYDESQPS